MNTWNAQLYDTKHAFVFGYGQSLVDLLAPRHEERILDLGCGTGHLTKQIAETGAKVIGLDKSNQMLQKAKFDYPELQFVQGDATQLIFDEPFDAVFSNATLHWILDSQAVTKAIYQSLCYNGRFVAEFGGKGNVGSIVQALTSAIRDVMSRELAPLWFFPSIGEYTQLLEESGFEVQFAQLYDRPTILEGEDGMKHWLRMFGGEFLKNVPSSKHAQIIDKTVELLRPTLYQNGQWTADYRRLRVVARKV